MKSRIQTARWHGTDTPGLKWYTKQQLIRDYILGKYDVDIYLMEPHEIKALTVNFMARPMKYGIRLDITIPELEDG
jgi:hypothetical protein